MGFIEEITNKNVNKLKPLNKVIQVCPICGKIDAYKNDGHECKYRLIKKLICSD